jgi:hypothetical protein
MERIPRKIYTYEFKLERFGLWSQARASRRRHGHWA